MRYLIVIVSCLMVATSAVADDRKNDGHRLPSVQLETLLDAVSKNTDLRFAVDHQVPSSVVTGQLGLRDMNYEELLLVLRNNAMAAVRSGGVVNIVPVAVVRQVGVPIIDEDARDIHAEEWVMRVVEVEHSAAKMYVPIMRPLLPKQGHMVANIDANSLIIVARYATLQRIVSLIETLDQTAGRRQQQP